MNLPVLVMLVGLVVGTILVLTAEAVDQVAGEGRQITEELETSHQNIRHLTEAIRRTPGLPLDARILLRDSVHLRSSFQPALLDSAVLNLGSVQRALDTMPRRKQ